MGYFEILMYLFSFVLFCYAFRNKNGLPTNWPFVGMLPSLLKNLHRINNFVLEVVEKSQLTFLLEGPWFTNMQLLITVDPTNVHHVMSKNFGNYPKGKKLNEILDVLGEGVFSTDFDVWQYHRKMAQSFIGDPRFHRFLVKKVWKKVEDGLVPVLDQVSEDGSEVDLQDLFERFTFDTICSIIMDHDPRSLSVDLPNIPSSKAIYDVQEVMLYRHVVPTWVWKFQRWLGVGQEKKYKKAWETLDAFIYKCVAWKREEVISKRATKEKEDEHEIGVDLLTLYIEENVTVTTSKNADKFLRDTILNFIMAGRDTTSATLSWFFYLLSKNPQVVSKIKEELDIITLQATGNDKKGDYKLLGIFEEFSDRLVYLHGALCEALRLYPPVVFEAKSPLEPDILPSGHKVNPKMQIIFNLYAMARMKSIWGDDCNEFKPERWISERRKIRHEPSYKFFSFNAGPRACVGKNMALTQMKIVAAVIIQNYHIQATQAHPIVLDFSIILHMKYGFKAKVLKK